jgi:DNA gyrase/topoisomerase IV subunit A
MESGPGLALRLGKIDDRLEILDGYLKVFLDIDAVTASSARRTSRAPC